MTDPSYLPIMWYRACVVVSYDESSHESQRSSILIAGGLGDIGGRWRASPCRS
jgi:hypothetical protein